MLHCSSGLKCVCVCFGVYYIFRAREGECECHYSNLFPVTRKNARVG